MFSLNMLKHSLWWIMKICYILIQVKDNSSLYINVLFYHCTLHVCSPWSPYSTRQFHNYVISIFSFIRIKSGGGSLAFYRKKHTLYFLTLTCLDNYTRIQSFKKKKEFFFSLFLTWISSTNFFVTTLCYGLVLDTNHKLTL